MKQTFITQNSVNYKCMIFIVNIKIEIEFALMILDEPSPDRTTNRINRYLLILYLKKEHFFLYKYGVHALMGLMT